MRHEKSGRILWMKNKADLFECIYFGILHVFAQMTLFSHSF